MINIVVPMAGRGSRFRAVGYPEPKPFISVNGRPMIEWVIRNIVPSTLQHRFIFLVLEEHLQRYHAESELNRITVDPIVIPVESVTEGAACTVLLAEQFINNNHPLMIVNSDQLIDYSIDDYLKAQAGYSECSGCIMTMVDTDPKWSFAEIDLLGYVTRVVEKQVVSEYATVGIYNFAHGRDFVRAAEDMIKADDRVNGEFYVAPVYNYLIREGLKIGHNCIGPVSKRMWGLGTPEDLKRFLNSEICEPLLMKLRERYI